MIRTYRFDKAFGSTAAFAGTLIFIAGIIGSFFSFVGLAFALFGAFIAFTNSSTTIDIEHKRVRFTNNIFGVIRTGKWISIEHDMQAKIGLENKIHRTYSMSNRSIEEEIHNTIIYLCDSSGNTILPMMKVLPDENPVEKIEEIAHSLNISKYA